MAVKDEFTVYTATYYHIGGNFRMRALPLHMGHWARAKVKTVKVSSGASGDVFKKVCTHESFPLYGTMFFAWCKDSVKPCNIATCSY